MERSTRREFLERTAGAAGAAVVAACASSSGVAPPTVEPWFRISLAEWSFHRALHGKELDHLDFAATARRDFGIEAVEYVSGFFPAGAHGGSHLRDLRRRAEDAGVRSLLIMVDGEGALADADDGARARAIENHRRWLDAAGFLGCHAIRVNAAGSGERGAQHDRAADSLHRLGEMADPLDLSVIVENHGGLSSDGAWLAGVLRAAAHRRVGSLPDFGNFHLGNGQWYDRYVGVRELMPFARAVSAKSHEFDDAGNEVRTDYRRMLRIVRDATYRGWIGIEYEGDRHSEREGIARTKALLERVRAELA